MADYADAEYFGTYVPLLAMTIVGVLLVSAMFLSNRLLRPTASTHEKLLTYECGVDPVGEGWAQQHVRYYVFAYLYVIFAVDAVFLFPWATVFAAPPGIPVPGDYDGDRRADCAVYDPRDARWYVGGSRGPDVRVPRCGGTAADRLELDGGRRQAVLRPPDQFLGQQHDPRQGDTP